MVTPTKLLPDQYETIEGDLIYKEGATRELRPNTPAVGPGDSVRVRGANAAPGSNTNGGDGIIAGGPGDGTGKKGRARAESPIFLPKVNPTQFVARGANESTVYAGDDTGNTELFADTPLGIVQITKGGALNTSTAPVPAVDASLSNELFTTILGGPGDPTPITVGPFKALSYPAGATRAARSQVVIPRDFRDNIIDSVDVVVRYTIGGAGANNIVRLQTSGGADANTIAPTIYSLDVSGTTPGVITQSPAILSLSSSVVSQLSSLAIFLQRTTFVGEFTQDFQLVSIVFLFKSKAVVAALSVSKDDLYPTLLMPPAPGVMGVYKTLDFPPAMISEIAASFVIPRDYDPTSDCFLQLSFAMSTSQVGGRVDLSISGSINNNTPIAPSPVSIFPGPTLNIITRSFGLRNLAPGVNPLDSVAVLIQRTAGDTHGGAFRLVQAHLIMGAAISVGPSSPETDYPFVDAIPGAGPPDTETASFLGAENETYETAIGTNNNQDVTFVVRGRCPSTSLAGILAIHIIHKVSAAVGNNKVIVTVRKADGTVLYTSAPLVSAVRAELVISGVALSSQPAPGERFLVLCQAVVDNGATVYVGSEVTIVFS